MATTTKAQEMIAWAQTWADFFAPAVADDNAWYTMGGIDGKDAADLGEGLAEVARLLTVAQERIAALAVLDRLFAHDPQAQIEMRRDNDGMVTVRVPRAEMMSIGLWPFGRGDSPAAALLALGARLEGQDCSECDEGGSEDA